MIVTLLRIIVCTLRWLFKTNRKFHKNSCLFQLYQLIWIHGSDGRFKCSKSPQIRLLIHGSFVVSTFGWNIILGGAVGRNTTLSASAPTADCQYLANGSNEASGQSNTSSSGNSSSNFLNYDLSGFFQMTSKGSRSIRYNRGPTKHNKLMAERRK